MKILLHYIKFFYFILLLLAFSGNINAQCSISGTNVNASTLNSSDVCTTFLGCTTIYVGNGTTETILTLNEGLDFKCLGAINFVIMNHATLVFGNSANDKLTLGEGSSITVNSGGNLSGGGNCTSSDRIVIGTNLVSTCDGNAGTDVSFPDIINLGGTGSATSNSPFCVGNSINLSATPPPNGGPYTYLWSGPNGFSSTSQNPISFSATTSPVTAGVYSVSMTSTTLSTNKSIVAQTTVVVNSAAAPAAPTITAGGLTTFCSGGSVTLTSSSGASYLWSTGATTQSISAISSGSYSVQVTNASGCQSNSSEATVVTVKSLVNNVGNGFSSSSFCAGDQATITFNADNGSGVYPYILVYKNDTTNATESVEIANDDQTTFNIVPNPLVTADYTLVSITDANGCVRTSGFDDFTATATINPLPNAPTIATTQPTCSLSTGTITITGVAGETYSFDSGDFSTILVYSGLAQGSSHTIYAKNSSGCTSQVTNVTINILSTKTWNGSWSPSLPTSNDLVVIAANYSTSSNGNINACSLVVNSGSKLTIEAEKFVIIQNDLTVNGTLEVLDKGSLVMVNDSGVVTNSGTTNIHRFTTPFKMYDYVYWSSPVTSANIATTLLGWRTGNAYEYDTNSANWKYTSTMTPAKGVIVMVPNPIAGPGGNQTEVVFTGTLNNGVNKITGVVPNGSYLLGNPYPSAIDADEFLMQNVGVIGGTLSFWTHSTAIQLASNITNGSAGSGAYAYTSDDYATYNLVGGVTTKTASAGGIIPTGEIASCQGFFAKCNATISGAAEIVFNNSMRLGSSGTPLDNSQFFKTTKVKRTSVVQKNRVWLSLTNAQGAFKQTLIGYVTGATNGIDSLYDGESLDGNDYVDFYSITEGKNLVIQGRALPFDENDELPLGFRTTIAGAFTISIDQLDGLLGNHPVYLEDKMTNTLFDLKSGNYTFNTIKGSFNDRFVLRYTAKIISGNKTLGLDETDANDGIMVLYSNNYKTLIIKNNLNDATVNSVTLFNMLGQKINYWDIKDSQQTSIQIPIKNVSSEMYVVKVKTTKGESSKKIVIR